MCLSEEGPELGLIKEDWRMWCKRVFKSVCVFFYWLAGTRCTLCTQSSLNSEWTPALSAELSSNEWAGQKIFRVETDASRGYSKRVKTLLPHHTKPYALLHGRWETTWRWTATGLATARQCPGTLLKRLCGGKCLAQTTRYPVSQDGESVTGAVMTESQREKDKSSCVASACLSSLAPRALFTSQ